MRLAADAGAEYVRYGDVEIRFPSAAPAAGVVRVAAPDAPAAPLGSQPAPASSGYPEIQKLFRGGMPKLGSE